MFDKLLENCLEEGRWGGTTAVLRIYRDIERKLDPSVEDLDEALVMFLDYLADFTNYWRERPGEIDWWQGEDLPAIKKRFFDAEKDVEQALKAGTSEGEKLIALDRVVDLVHGDTPTLEGLLRAPDEEKKTSEYKELQSTISQILVILRKLGRYAEAVSGVDPEGWVIWDPKQTIMGTFPTEKEAKEFRVRLEKEQPLPKGKFYSIYKTAYREE